MTSYFDSEREKAIHCFNYWQERKIMGEKKCLGFSSSVSEGLAPNKQWRASQEGDSEVGTVGETDLKEGTIIAK